MDAEVTLENNLEVICILDDEEAEVTLENNLTVISTLED